MIFSKTLRHRRTSRSVCQAAHFSFEESFKNTSGLRLQDLTSGDIRRFVAGKLSTDPRIRQLADNEPSQKHYFVRQVCNKAQGVFLWVKLVTRSLLDGLHNSDRIADLRARLDRLPTDLEDLYRYMISQIDNLYLVQALQIFQMIQAASRVQAMARSDNQRTTPVTVLLLALAIEEDTDATVQTASDSWTAQKLSLLCDTMRRRLQTWCAGLIEVPDFIWNRVDALDEEAGLRTKITWEVAYLHRTARDFIESNHVWSMLLERASNTNFDPYASLLKATVLLYKVAGQLVGNPLGYGLFPNELLEPASDAMLYAQRAQSTTGDSYLTLLDELDKIMDRHLVRWTGVYFGHWSQFLNVTVPKNTMLSFVDLAIFFGLDQYVLSKIASEYLGRKELHKDDSSLREYFKSDPKRTDRAITLLDMAVRPGCPSSKMAQILLEHGADVNETSGDPEISTWERVLKRAELSSKHNDGAEKWLQIIEVFLRHDVDMRGSYGDAGETRRRVSNVIGGFRARYPYQVAALMILIDKRLREPKGKGWKLWAIEMLGSRTSSHSSFRTMP